MKVLIKDGRIIDPVNNTDTISDVFIEDGKIVQIGKALQLKTEQTIDATNKVVMPGIVDMHVHLRQPGREDKETILSGTRAALKGGVTSVLAMANTLICIDSVENIRLLKNLICASAQANVFITASITKGCQGKELTDSAALKKEGAIAISDDGASLDSTELMFEALKQAKNEGLLVTCHCEDRALSREGVVNLGFTSTRLGLRGISKESEYKRVERDIKLAEKANAPIHIAHVSCTESVEIIAKAKKRGVQVTCETAPHYFALDEEAVLGYDTNRKMNPPLRGKDDVLAIKEGLRNGTIDAIASDHAPHTENEKEIEFDRAEFGTIGLETILAVSLTELFHTGLLGLTALLAKLTSNPGRILKIEKGTLTIGRDADLAIVSLDKEWLVKKEELVSKSKNSAFIGKRLKGIVEYTICGGKIAYACTS